MTILTITRGLPGSGKSTYARKWVAEDPEHRAEVNRDNLRAHLHGGYVSGEVEYAQITTARDALITALLKRGIDVISSDTNLPSRTARDLRRLAALAGADFDVIDLTDVSWEVCLDRDALRDEPVGQEVVVDMYRKYIKGRPHPLPIADEPEDAAGKPYVAPVGKLKAILIDIDGTVALKGDRSPYDWERVGEDLPNEPVLEVVKGAWAHGLHLIFMSGRDSVCRETTRDWLWNQLDEAFDLADLFMRPEGDTRKDSVVKLELFDKHVRDNYDVQFVLDDRQQVVDMWRSIGLTVMQVAPGDF